jgi:hypothetical protein
MVLGLGVGVFVRDAVAEEDGDGTAKVGVRVAGDGVVAVRLFWQAAANSEMPEKPSNFRNRRRSTR